MQAGEDVTVTAVASAEVLSEEEQAQADQEQAAWAAAEAAAAELMAEEQQAQAKQQQVLVKAAAKKAKRQQQRAKNPLQLTQAQSNDQPKTAKAPQPAAATAAFNTSALLHSILDSRSDLRQAMHPVAAQHKEGGLAKTQTVSGVMQQQQGPLKTLPKTGTRDSPTNSASYPDICSVDKPPGHCLKSYCHQLGHVWKLLQHRTMAVGCPIRFDLHAVLQI